MDKLLLEEEERLSIVSELYETEENYNEHLELIDIVYAKGLRNSIENDKIPIMDKNTYDTIFKDLEIIKIVNKNLLEALNSNEKRKKVGKIFSEFASSFKTYLSFCSNYENIIKKLEEFRSRDNFDEYLYERKYSPENTPGYSLESYLILPIQRIPRYELLLSDLLKFTPKEHEDYEDIQNSITQIKNVAIFVNQNLKYFKEKEKLREIVRSMKNLPKGLEFTNRRFLSDSRVRLVSKDGLCEEVYLFIFNDLFLICREKTFSHNLYFQHSISLTKQPFLWINDVYDTEFIENAFEIVESSNTFFLICDDYTHKIELLKRLLCQIDEITDFNADIAEKRAILKGFDDKNREKEKEKQEKKMKLTGNIGKRISMNLSQMVSGSPAKQSSKSGTATPNPSSSIQKNRNSTNNIFSLSKKTKKPEIYPKNRKELIVELDYMKSFKLLGYNDCHCICRSKDSFNSYLFTDKLEDEIYYNEHDLFLVFASKIKHSNIEWSLVKKVGMNCSPANRKRIKDHKILKSIMIEYSKEGKIPDIYVELDRKMPMKQKNIVNFISLCDDDRISEDIILKDMKSPNSSSMNSPRFHSLDKYSTQVSSVPTTPIPGNFTHVPLTGKSKSLKTKSDPNLPAFVKDNLSVSDTNLDLMLKNDEKSKQNGRKKKLSFVGRIASKLLNKSKKETSEINTETNFNHQFYQSIENRPNEKLDIGLIPSALLEEFPEDVTKKIIEKLEKRDNEELEDSYGFWSNNFGMSNCDQSNILKDEIKLGMESDNHNNKKSELRKSKKFSTLIKKGSSNTSGGGLTPRSKESPRNSSHGNSPRTPRGRESDSTPLGVVIEISGDDLLPTRDSIVSGEPEDQIMYI
eukprot:gene5860-9688_t